MTELDEPVHLFPYNQEWPHLYASEARRIRVSLPADVAVEHIGSTSVADLLAKPIIDIMLGLETHHDQNKVRATLVTLGYEDLGEAGVPGRCTFAGERGRLSTSLWSSMRVQFGSLIWPSGTIFGLIRKRPASMQKQRVLLFEVVLDPCWLTRITRAQCSVVCWTKLCRGTSKQSGLICDRPLSSQERMSSSVNAD